MRISDLSNGYSTNGAVDSQYETTLCWVFPGPEPHMAPISTGKLRCQSVSIVRVPGFFSLITEKQQDKVSSASLLRGTCWPNLQIPSRLGVCKTLLAIWLLRGGSSSDLSGPMCCGSPIFCSGGMSPLLLVPGVYGALSVHLPLGVCAL